MEPTKAHADLGALMTALDKDKGCFITPDTLPDPGVLIVSLGPGRPRQIVVDGSGWRFAAEPDEARRPHATDERATAQEIFDALEGWGRR